MDHFTLVKGSNNRKNIFYAVSKIDTYQDNDYEKMKDAFAKCFQTVIRTSKKMEFLQSGELFLASVTEIAVRCLNILKRSFETMSTLMYDISNNSAPQNISGLFRKSNLIHPYKTRSSSSVNFYIQYLRLNQQHNSTTRFGARVWNCLPPKVCQLPKKQFKKKVQEILFAIFHAEDTYVEEPTLLLKLAKYVK